MWSAALLQFGGILLHPAVDRGVIDVQTPFEYHLQKARGSSKHTAGTSERRAE